MLYLHIIVTFTGHQMNSLQDVYHTLHSASEGIRFYEHGTLEMKRH
jgi:hypothetical protein